MQTPLKLNIKRYKIRSLKFSLTKIFNYSVYVALTILIGGMAQLIYSPSRDIIGKSSILTGLPIIRNYFFLFPLLLSLSAFIWTIVNFREPEISKSSEHSLFRFLIKIKLAYLVTNSVLWVFFYFVYYQAYIPLWKSHEFKLSGHVLACLFSGGILTNIQQLCEMFKNENIKRDLMQYTINACKFFLFHNLYCIFWTSWVFHKIRETVISFFLGLIAVVIINSLGLDRLVVFIFSSRPKKVFNGKQKNIFLDNYA